MKTHNLRIKRGKTSWRKLRNIHSNPLSQSWSIKENSQIKKIRTLINLIWKSWAIIPIILELVMVILVYFLLLTPAKRNKKRQIFNNNQIGLWLQSCIKSMKVKPNLQNKTPLIIIKTSIRKRLQSFVNQRDSLMEKTTSNLIKLHQVKITKDRIIWLCIKIAPISIKVISMWFWSIHLTLRRMLSMVLS